MKNLNDVKNDNNCLSEYSQYVLCNTSNYKPLIKKSVSEILNKFVEIVIEYMRFVSDKFSMKNKKYHNFIFERGIETLIHVFSMIFYYTKNLELSFYHTQKSYYFYIEFIERISDDNITFLQLSSRDAILFVYKKTIFDLNNEFKKNMKEPNPEEKNILETVDSYIHIYKSIVLYVMNHNSFNYENKKDYINMCSYSIKIVSESLNKNKMKHNQIECIYIFTTLLFNTKIEIHDFFNLLDEFIKKVNTKKKINEKIIKNKIYDLKTSNFIINNELNKIVDCIFSN
jgi:hypothetical protein